MNRGGPPHGRIVTSFLHRFHHAYRYFPATVICSPSIVTVQRASQRTSDTDQFSLSSILFHLRTNTRFLLSLDTSCRSSFFKITLLHLPPAPEPFSSLPVRVTPSRYTLILRGRGIRLPHGNAQRPGPLHIVDVQWSAERYSATPFFCLQSHCMRLCLCFCLSVL